jgi:hypothetical protein
MPQGVKVRAVSALCRRQYGSGGRPSQGVFSQGVHFYSRQSPRGLAHFVAAALPNIPIRAVKLEDGTSYIDVPRGFPAWIRCACRYGGVAPQKSSRTKRRNNPCLFFARPRPRLKKKQPPTCLKRFSSYLYRVPVQYGFQSQFSKLTRAARCQMN